MSGQNEFHPRDFRHGLRHAGLTHGEFRVAVELSEYCGVGKPEVWPSVAKLAETCDMTERGIQRALEHLAGKGVVALVFRTKGGRGSTNRWRLLVKTPNEGSGFTTPGTPNDGSPFEDETPNRITPKPRTDSLATPNPRSPEVVRSRETEGDTHASEPTAQTGSHSPEPMPLYEFSIEPPKRACTQYPHSAPCGTCASDNRALDAWKRHGPQQLSALQDQINKLEGRQHRSLDNDQRRELGRQITALRGQRTRWLGVLRAEGVAV